MYDNVCKFLAEKYPDDISQWLLGKPVKLTKLSPTELSNEPIRADSLILQQSADTVLHTEFQTQPSEKIPFRMADYRLRVYRRFPDKKMVQVVIYLKPSNSPLVYEDKFEIEGLTSEFRVIRLWEQPQELFLTIQGLLPFAVLSNTDNPTETLTQVAQVVENINDRKEQSDLIAVSTVLAGLKLNKDTIGQILRSDIMKESVIYQEILEEGRLKGKLESKLEVASNLLREGMTTAKVAQITDLSLTLVESLAKEINREINT